MAVFRVEKTQDYSVMSNYHMKEKEMSLKAKGLLSLMLSLPENWDYSINGLVAICKENQTAIISTLQELKRFGYLQIYKLMPNETTSGRIEYVYVIYEKPTFEKLDKQKCVDVSKQEGKKQALENLGLENQVQLNTNNKIYNNIKESVREKSTIPTLEEVIDFGKENSNIELAKRFYKYYSIADWKDTRGRDILNWKQKFISWINFLEEKNQIEDAKTNTKTKEWLKHTQYSSLDEIFDNLDEVEL